MIRQILFIATCLLPLATAGQPRSPASMLEKGELALEQRQDRTALAHLNECLRLDPQLWQAYYLRGIARERLADSRGAITDYSIFLEQNPTLREALFSRATLRFQLSQYELAREDFQQLLRLPASTGTGTESVYFELSGGTTQKIFTAQSDMRSVVFNYLGQIDTQLKYYTRAISYFDSCIRLDPARADFFLNRGVARQQSGDKKQAIQDYQRALELNPASSLAQHNLAVLLKETGSKAESEALISKAIREDPKQAYLYEERGHLLMSQQKWSAALADFTKAIELDATDPDYWINRAICKEHGKDLPGALADLTQAIRIDATHEKAWLNRGNVLTKMNRLREAMEDYTVAITHYPEYGLAFYNRGIARQKAGALREACQDITKAELLGVQVDEKVRLAVCKK
jgi:tetratricopeptide (TPR) repeat protein